MEIKGFEKVLLDVHFGPVQDDENKQNERKAQVYLVKDIYYVDCWEGDDVKEYVQKSSYRQAEDAAENWCLGYHP